MDFLQLNKVCQVSKKKMKCASLHRILCLVSSAACLNLLLHSSRLINTPRRNRKKASIQP